MLVRRPVAGIVHYSTQAGHGEPHYLQAGSLYLVESYLGDPRVRSIQAWRLHSRLAKE